MNLEYIRTDKNGTKIFHDWTCQRCGGAGSSTKWAFTGCICYECGGSGRGLKPAIVKEYTPEYEAKLKARREARAAKRLAENPPPSQEELEAKAEETRRRNWKLQGFREDGVGYVHSGNTYANKDALKAAGGRWTYELRAYVAPQPITGLEGIKITEAHAQDLCNSYGWMDTEHTQRLFVELNNR
jgi:hypothetical protein